MNKECETISRDLTAKIVSLQLVDEQCSTVDAMKDSLEFEKLLMDSKEDHRSLRRRNLCRVWGTARPIIMPF